MSEVEKLYELAEVKADRTVCYRGFDNCIDNDFNCHCHNEKPCNDATKIYPPFTTEKQLELIKWMVNTNHRYFLLDVEENDFEESLAKVFNLYWSDLTEIDHEEIRKILKG